MNDSNESITRDECGPGALCRMDEHVVDAVKSGGVPGRLILSACLTILFGTLAYGFVFGLWRSPVQGLYSASKMPLVFFGTVLASGGVNTMLAQLMGTGLSFRQVTASILLGMAICAALLAALAPIVLFFLLQIPGPDTALLGLDFHDPAAAEAKRTYQVLLVVHVAVIGAAGIVGNIRLYGLLRALVGTRRMAAGVLAIWIAVSGFVGCEISWLLSPFICKPTIEPHFIPREYFQENFYERVWHSIRE